MNRNFFPYTKVVKCSTTTECFCYILRVKPTCVIKHHFQFLWVRHEIALPHLPDNETKWRWHRHRPPEQTAFSSPQTSPGAHGWPTAVFIAAVRQQCRERQGKNGAPTGDTSWCNNAYELLWPNNWRLHKNRCNAYCNVTNYDDWLWWIIISIIIITMVVMVIIIILILILILLIITMILC